MEVRQGPSKDEPQHCLKQQESVEDEASGAEPQPQLLHKVTLARDEQKDKAELALGYVEPV